MTKEELAISYFYKGYSCSQSIVLAFKEYIPNIDEKTLLKISSPFGGGLGRLRQTCGAFSAIAIILGYLYGNDSNSSSKKEDIYRRTQELAKEFINKYGSLSCKQLLNIKDDNFNPIPDKRTSEYYKNRPCPEIIGYCASILDKYLKNNK